VLVLVLYEVWTDQQQTAKESTKKMTTTTNTETKTENTTLSTNLQIVIVASPQGICLCVIIIINKIATTTTTLSSSSSYGPIVSGRIYGGCGGCGWNRSYRNRMLR
jgi:hypothetical protein